MERRLLLNTYSHEANVLDSYTFVRAGSDSFKGIEARDFKFLLFSTLINRLIFLVLASIRGYIRDFQQTSRHIYSEESDFVVEKCSGGLSPLHFAAGSQIWQRESNKNPLKGLSHEVEMC